MLPVPFSFSGRIARWPYFKGCVALVAAAIIPVVLALSAYPAMRDGNTAAMIGLVGILAVFGLVTFWISLTLQVRRCRDMGWDPWFVIPPWFALQIADPVLARYFPALAIGTEHDHTLIVAVVNLLLALALTFWPSAEQDAAPSAPIRGSRVASLPPSAPAVCSAPSTLPRAAVSVPRASFGRR